jgi:DNA-binding CsgD family transcriptional regulator
MYWIGLRPNPGPRKYEIAETIQVSLKKIAQHEGRPENDLLPELLAAGLTQYSTNDRLWKTWESLTPREQEATALVCLGFSNGQIAARMGITEAGVKFHLGNVYSKCRVKNRAKLRQKFAGWDFSLFTRSSKRGYHQVR